MFGFLEKHFKDYFLEEFQLIYHLMFYNNRTKLIKEEVLEKILLNNEPFFIEIIKFLFDYWKVFEVGDYLKYKAFAFSINTLLSKYEKQNLDLIDNKAYLILNNFYVERRKLLDELVKEDYYNYDLLEKYSQIYLLEEDNTFSSPILISEYISLYSRPDWNSFSQEIKVVSDIEYIHKISNWDYVKVGHQFGYLPPSGENKPTKKHSFLVEEEPIS